MIAITLSACSASARTAGSAAASSPETISRPIGSGFSSSASEHAAQASATPRPFGVAGRWNAAQPGFVVEPEPVAELRQPGAAAAAAAGPDQDGAVRGGDALLRASCRASARRPGRPRRRCGAPGGSRGRRSAHGRRPARRRRRRRSRRRRSSRAARGSASSAVRDRLGQHGRVRAEALAQQLAERVRLLDRLGAGERRHDPSLRAAQQRLGSIERVVPRQLAEALRRSRARAGRRSGRAA